MIESSTHRLVGLEPDNLLAFLALLGMLRTLEHVRPAWCPRVAWTVDTPPVRPTLTIGASVTEDEIVAAVAAGLADLADRHDFNQLKDLKLSPKEAAERLRKAVTRDRYTSDLWAGLTSDAAVRDKKQGARSRTDASLSPVRPGTHALHVPLGVCSAGIGPAIQAYGPQEDRHQGNGLPA